MKLYAGMVLIVDKQKWLEAKLAAFDPATGKNADVPLKPFIVERITLDPPATSKDEVYKRTNTGFGGVRIVNGVNMAMVYEPFVCVGKSWVAMDSHGLGDD